jgi:hypothetical protein
MKKGLRKILNEFNFRHDFDRVDKLWDSIAIHEDESIFKDFSKVFRNSIYYIANAFIKHTLRYGTFAAGLGALGSYISGGNPRAGAYWSFMVVACADANQYAIRSSLTPMIKCVYEDIRNGLVGLRDSSKEQANGFS